MNHAASPLYEQVAEAIARHIQSGALGPGERVPSLRRLSVQHGVSVSTAVEAYLSLENRGLIEARPKSGFYVRPRTGLHPPEPLLSRPGFAASKVSLGELRARLFRLSGEQDIVPLGTATPSAELLPVAQLNRTLGAAARRAGTAAIDYSPPPGCEPLRRQLSRRSLDWGCQLAPEEFITTSGAMEAIFLCLRATAKRGDVVALESPTYFGILEAVETLGLRVIQVPMHPQHGMDLDHLEAAIGRQRIAAVLAIPSFNNPLGSCMPDANRERLVLLLARHEVPLIEDDIYGDLAFPPAGRPRVAKRFDRRGLVLLCGSVSKTLAPGWRVGWVAPGERYYKTILQLKISSTLATASAPQFAVAEFLRDGGYDRHLRALRRAYAEQVRRMAQAVVEAFPPGIRISRPQGNFVLWVELPKGADAMELHRRALEERISVAPGPMFSAKGRQFARFIRLNCGAPWSTRIERGVAVLGHLVGQIIREGAGAARRRTFGRGACPQAPGERSVSERTAAKRLEGT
ncbi:MAG TPA: PLP-dependent aminotransferase family protein [Chthoniobacterales bacterium]